MVFSFRRTTALLATTTLVSLLPLCGHARAADQMQIMERQIQAMQAQLTSMKKEHAEEVKRARAVLARQREEAENTPYAQRGRYIGQPRPAAQPLISVRPAKAGADDGRPPSDRADVSSWSDFQRATAQDEEVTVGGIKVGFPGGRPTIQSSDGAYALSIGLAYHEDFGGFFNSGPRAGESRGAFNGFTSNQRRLRIPFMFRYKNWVAAVTPDFGANHNDGYVGLYEGNLNYTGLHNTVLTVGYFQPRVTEEDSESSNDFFTLERPSITDMVRNIAAGDARFSVGGLHYEKRWWVAGYFTGQEWGHRNASDMSSTYYGGGSGSTVDSQTGATLRVAGRPVVTKDVDLHVGASAISAFKVACNTGSDPNHCTRSTSFGQRPEFDIGEANLAATGTIRNASQVWAAGPELGLRWRRLIVKGEYYHVGVQRSAPGLKSASFQGWYGSAAYTLLGNPRLYNIKQGAFGAPGVTASEEFNPALNQWGALEVVGHYSVIDLNSGLNETNAKNVIRGGQQTVWTSGLNWYPNRHFRLMLDYSRFIVSRSEQATNTAGRTGNAIAARIQAAF
ncbi:OprO/OprP family phosphate-selective porin [Gluconobacter oxydans]|uniref:OprO/OprP family phosphate-selective porin n=1 Tax=Gluconobacter oxydans TaxID=442 RepID=UPI00209CC003|nr:porin [Gluconobacter oxydans]MCP1249403.1 OprO/OprP family phosphate-selective porin [Gluconobacter oxydans]